jgi:hypothetical protein
MDLSPVRQPLLNDVFTATGNATLATTARAKSYLVILYDLFFNVAHQPENARAHLRH